MRPGGVGRGGGGARRDGGVGGLKRRRRTYGDDLTHIDGRCRLAEGRTRGGSLPLTALIGSIDYIDELKDKINLVSRLREF